MLPLFGAEKADNILDIDGGRGRGRGGRDDVDCCGFCCEDIMVGKESKPSSNKLKLQSSSRDCTIVVNINGLESVVYDVNDTLMRMIVTN